MTNYQIWIINIILILNFINADILIDIGDATANAGETAEVAISIDFSQRPFIIDTTTQRI